MTVLGSLLCGLGQNSDKGAQSRWASWRGMVIGIRPHTSVGELRKWKSRKWWQRLTEALPSLPGALVWVGKSEFSRKSAKPSTSGYLYGSTEWELVEDSMENCCIGIASTSVVCSQVSGLLLVSRSAIWKMRWTGSSGGQEQTAAVHHDVYF